jgi:hypothetical protein
LIGSCGFVATTDTVVLFAFFNVVDEEGVLGFGTFFFAIESTLLGVAS